MIEIRWHRLGLADPAGVGMALTFESGASYVLQYRETLPRHPGFVMQADPTTGKQVESSDKWTDWRTVEGDDYGPAQEAAEDQAEGKAGQAGAA